MGELETVHDAVPAEDRMQAFLWRQLVPASDLPVLVFELKIPPASKRPPRVHPPPAIAVNASPSVGIPGVTTLSASANATAPKAPKFSKQQITGRLRKLRLLYEEGLLADDFYDARIAECEAAP